MNHLQTPHYMNLRSVVFTCALGCASANAANVTIGDSVIPAGLGVGDTFQLVFVSKGQTTRGTVGDGSDATIAFWDGFANDQAALSNHSDLTIRSLIQSMTWTAIVSTTTTSAIDQITIPGPLYNMNLELVANNEADLWDGALNAQMRYNQDGVVQTGSGETGRGVWTGTQSNGSTWGGGAYDALDDSGADAIKGDFNSTTGGWVSTATWRGNPAEAARVYALSETITIVAVPEPRAALLGGLGLLALLRRRR